jgi:hypothetical protein
MKNSYASTACVSYKEHYINAQKKSYVAELTEKHIRLKQNRIGHLIKDNISTTEKSSNVIELTEKHKRLKHRQHSCEIRISDGNDDNANGERTKASKRAQGQRWEKEVGREKWILL